MQPASPPTPRHDWTLPEIEALFATPFVDLLFEAQRTHRAYHPSSTVQMSTLLSIKTGACPEDCAYCPQSIRYDTGVERQALMQVEQVREAATRAKAAGATRFCMGAAYRSPKAKELALIKEMIAAVRALGLESCATLGMLTPGQAHELKDAGLDYYNHNLDTSPEYYGEIITTRTYQDRLDTLAAVRAAGMKVCCGGIVGMGETGRDRAQLLARSRTCRSIRRACRSTISCRYPALHCTAKSHIDPLDFVRTIAVARLTLPRAHVRLSAGRGGHER